MISIIVPLFNHLKETKEMFSSLLQSLEGRGDYEIVLIDDGSTDETSAWLDSLSAEKIIAIRNGKNLGYTRSVNIAAMHCTGDVLVLANNDLVFSDTWLPPMLGVLLDERLRAGVVGNVQRRVVDNAVDHAGMDLNYRGQLEHLHQLPPAGTQAIRCFAVTGACCMVKKEAFMQVGGFDERYLNGCEDVDLCFKLSAIGLHTYLAPSSSIHHHVSLTRGAAPAQNEVNSILLFSKWDELLRDRLASRWLELASEKQPKEPCVGASELSINWDHLKQWPDTARKLASSLLERNQRYRHLVSGRPVPNAAPVALDISPRPSNSVVPGYFHLGGRTVVVLPATLGLDGIQVRGHLLPSTKSLRGGIRVNLELDNVQSVYAQPFGGDFEVALDRPAVSVDSESLLEIWIEEDVEGEWKEPTGSSGLYPDLYIAGIWVDGQALALQPCAGL